MKIENQSNSENNDTNNPTKESRQDLFQENLILDQPAFKPQNVKNYRLKKPN